MVWINYCLHCQMSFFRLISSIFFRIFLKLTILQIILEPRFLDQPSFLKKYKTLKTHFPPSKISNVLSAVATNSRFVKQPHWIHPQKLTTFWKSARHAYAFQSTNSIKTRFRDRALLQTMGCQKRDLVASVLITRCATISVEKLVATNETSTRFWK